MIDRQCKQDAIVTKTVAQQIALGAIVVSESARPFLDTVGAKTKMM